MRVARRLQSRFESRKTTVSEMRWGTWALWHWSLMIDENFPKTYYEVRDITVNACIIDFTKPQIWAMVNQCAKTNLVPDCKPPAIAAKQRTTVGKVLCYCKYYKPPFRRLWKLSLHQFDELVFHQNARIYWRFHPIMFSFCKYYIEPLGMYFCKLFQ